MNRSCVFVCVFHQDKYVDMFLILLESLLLYGNLSTEIQLVVYTSTCFMQKIKQSPLYDDSILFELNDTYDTVEKACYARLDLFHLPLIQTFTKILYLDTDILIKEELQSVFELCQEEKLYVLEEGCLTDSDEYYGGKTLFGGLSQESAFTSGIMLFPNCDIIQKLFDTIHQDIRDRGHVFECYDQPYIVYHAIRLDLCSKTLGKVAINNNSSITSTKTIHHFPGIPGFYEEKLKKMELFLDELNRTRYVCGMRIIGRSIPAKKKDFLLVGICVSYQYFDTLCYMLPVNYIHFDKLYIITQEDDRETIEFCRNFPNVEVLYYSFKSPGKFFDKFGALNMGQRLLYSQYPEAWYLILDSDILLPNNLIDLFLQENLNPECIYGGIRNNVYQTSELRNKKSIVESKENRPFVCNDLRNIKEVPPFILGCFQLYKKKVFHREGFENASFGDVCFCHDNFDRICILNHLEYFHLGLGGVNWSGKVVSFKKDVNLHCNELYYSCHKECSNTYYNKSTKVIGYSQSATIDEDLLTCSNQMRIDMANFFKGKKYTIAEIGAHKGYTTRVLSTLFHQVYSVDNHLEWTQISKHYNRDLRNIEYVSFDIYKEDWNVLPETIDVVVMHGLQSYQSCKSVLLHSVNRFKQLKYIIFDDYGVWNGVKQLVDQYVYEKKLIIEAYIGLADFPGPNGIVRNTHEGIICSIQRSVSPMRFSIPIRKTSKMMLHTNYRPNP